jgi:uncharacterized Zn-binding protein involved in type VI secretion
MAGEIIRLGDPTSHGGKVVEGSMADICHGKPIAYMGHKTYCPQCKGYFPIIDGAPTTTFYGKGVALAGMKTACGAILIATQLTDIVVCGGGNFGSNLAERRRPSGAPAAGVNSAAQFGQAGDPIVEEHFYALVGEDGEPADGYLYDLHSGTTLRVKAAGYAEGATVRIHGTATTSVVTWLEKDGGSKS